jgi:hypothetical protein
MRIKNKKDYYIRQRTVSSDGEGGKIVSYGTAKQIQANIYPASGKVQAEMYGERLAYILNMLYDGSESIRENDGICVNVAGTEKPDYKVISIKQYTSHKMIELEKLL